MSDRAVRDTCISLANASTSRAERVALMAIAFLAERDESDECVALRPKLDACLSGYHPSDLGGYV